MVSFGVSDECSMSLQGPVVIHNHPSVKDGSWAGLLTKRLFLGQSSVQAIL